MFRILFACSAVLIAEARSLYAIDPTWKPAFPEGSDVFSGVAVAEKACVPGSTAGEVYVTQRGNASINPVLVFDPDGKLLRTWGNDALAFGGAHGIAVECLPSGSTTPATVRVWVDDFTNHTLTAFDPFGRQLVQAG